MLLHAHEQFTAATTAYATARELEPRTFAWAYLSGVVYAERGDHRSSVAQLADAVRLAPGHLGAWLRFGEQLRLSGELERGEAVYERLLRDDPDSALARYGLGQLRTAQGRHAAALREYERTLELVPQFGAASYALGLTLQRLGRSTEAAQHVAAYQRNRQHRPVLQDPLLEEVRAMTSGARQLIADAARLGDAGDVTASIALHERALEADPAAAQAHVNLIALYAQSGQAGKAEMHYRAAIKLGSSLADAHYNYAVLLASTGRTDDAFALFARALAANPLHPQALNNTGQLLARRGNLAEASVYVRRALASDPQYRAARFNLGRLLLAQGHEEEAIAHLSRLSGVIDSDSPRHFQALAEAHAARGDVSEAIQWATRAREQARTFGQQAIAQQLDKHIARWQQVLP